MELLKVKYNVDLSIIYILSILLIVILSLLLNMVPALLLMSVSLTLIIVLCGTDRRILYISLLAYFIRCVLSLYQYFIGGLPDSSFDAVVFHEKAIEWVSSGIVRNFTTGAFLYSVVLAVFYYLLEPQQLIGQLLNSLFGSLIIITIYRCMQELIGKSSKYSIKAAIILAFTPTLCLYSALTMREGSVVLPLSIAFLFIIKWFKYRRYVFYVAAVVFCGLSTLFHSASAVILIALILITTFEALVPILQRNHALLNRTISNVIPLLIVVMLFGVMLSTGAGLEKLQIFDEKEGSIEQLSAQQAYASRSRAAYLQDMQVSSAGDIIWQLPIRVIYFLFTPFIWTIRSGADIFGLLDASLYLYLSLIILLKRKRFNAIDKRIAFILIIYISAFALGTSNYGTAIRHRAKALPVLAVLSMVALHRNSGSISPSQKLLGIRVRKPRDSMGGEE